MKKENLSLILDLLADSHRALEKKLQEETYVKEYWIGECVRMEKVQSEGKVAEDEAV